MGVWIYKEFTSYLWGIETISQAYPEHCHLYSHPTYEELKHIIIPLPCRPDIDSHPTYEELKRTSRIFLYFLPQYSHPTYEELKPGGGLPSNYAERGIHILPMRNWNNLLLRKILKLLGIHILPMRNWNFTVKVESDSFLQIHILPMRNWNMSFATPGHSVLAFTSYLWGIET